MAFSSRAHRLDALSTLGKWLDQQPAASIPSRLDFFVCGGACFLFH
jgi:hypothetical protein